MTGLRAGIDYPRSDGEFQSWFGTDADCLDYLEWLRWPKGFVCPRCGFAGGWPTADGRFKCTLCETKTSITAGTLFDRRRTPLTVWFAAVWMFATQKDGVSALSLQRALEIGSYQTAWAMLHRLRSVLVRPGRAQLTGVVEMDETVMGGFEPGLTGGRSRGLKKTLVAVAVERNESRGLGRCRISPIPDASSATLRAFLVDNVEEGSTVITDGWPAYQMATNEINTHERHVVPGSDAPLLLPGVHRVASLSKRWLLGTHQGAVEADHLGEYLNEFAFRFNRRGSRSRGLVFYRVLELAVAHDPVRYRELVVNPVPKSKAPRPPEGRGHPPTMDRPPAGRLWRGP
jgi:transposase-like protein